MLNLAHICAIPKKFLIVVSQKNRSWKMGMLLAAESLGKIPTPINKTEQGRSIGLGWFTGD